MNRRNRKLICAFVSMALVLCAFSGAVTLTAQAASNGYYICYESGDYKVHASNALKKGADGEYTVSPYLTRGDKFYISDGAGRLWGDAKGQPVTVTETGRHRYLVRFNPDTPYANGSFVASEFYSPANFQLQAGSQNISMTYLKANAAFEQYYAYAEVAAGDVVTVLGEKGQYGEGGLGTDGVTVNLAGKYRFTFTADADNLFDGEDYIRFSEMPSLYLLCAENGFAVDESYAMTRDEDVLLYETYTAPIAVPEKDCELSYSVYNADTAETFKPSKSGKVTVQDKGTYDVLYSPDHVYSAVGDDEFHVSLRRVSEFYDGWFVLGDFNGFTFIPDSAEFSETYRLVKDDAQTSYDEYTLTLTVREEELRQFDGHVEFYIGDGANIHRKPNGKNIVIERAGEYEITFSPTHDYGRGYRYRYVRNADENISETVRIETARQFAAFLAQCTSPEFSLNKTFVLANDVSLAGMNVTPALVFAGTFDGMYRTVSGVSLADGQSASLFKRVTVDGTLQRATFETTCSSQESYTALVGENSGVLSEITAKGQVEGKEYAAGIAASNTSDGQIKDCKNYASVNGVVNAGGVVGFNAGKIENCVNYGAINGKTFSASDASSMLNTGGVSGYSTGLLIACINYGEVGHKQGRYVGGIAGLCSGGIYACVNYGKISGVTYAGGVVGYYGRFSSEGGDIGDYLSGGAYEKWLEKYFGSDSGTFEEAVDSGIHEVFYALNGGSVFAENYAGGIGGHLGASGLQVTGCVSAANVEAHASHAGGIAAQAQESNLDGCLSYGDVTAADSYAGGIAGQSTGKIQNCQSSAYVRAKNYAGGIAGQASAVESSVSNAYVDTVEAGAHYGMIAGDGALNGFRYNYYVVNAAGGIDGADYGYSADFGAHGLSADALMSRGMLSDALKGLSADDWLAGESESRFPVPRALTEKVEPSAYNDKAAFAKAFDTVAEILADRADVGSRTTVTVTFYTYDFDAEKYEKATGFRLHKGEGIAESDVPQVPQEEGYFVWWDRDDFSRFDENTAVYQKYDKATTSLASDDGDKPLVLAEGVFYSDTELRLDYNGEYVSLKFLRGGKETSCGDVRVKYYVGGSGGYTVKLIRGGEMKDAAVTVHGEYLGFVLEEGWAFAAVKSSSDLFALWMGLSAGGGAVIVAAAFIVGLLIRKRKKIAAATQTTENGTVTDNAERGNAENTKAEGATENAGVEIVVKEERNDS